jgi:hypothetical protein
MKEKYIRIGTALYKVELEMVAYCRDVMELSGKDVMPCCAKDLINELRDLGLRTEVTQVRNILKDNWGLQSVRNGDYTFYHIGIEGELIPLKRKGRYLSKFRVCWWRKSCCYVVFNR